MSNIKYSNYVGEGPEAEAMIQEAKKLAGQTRKDAAALAEAMGLEAGQNRDGRIICFLGPDGHLLPADKMKELGIRDRGGLLKVDDVFRKAYIPDRRYKAGKELEKKLDAINKNAVSISQALIRLMKIGRMVCYGHVMASSTAGFDHDKILVRIPGLPDDGNDSGDKFPALPAWLREPQGEEWKDFVK